MSESGEFHLGAEKTPRFVETRMFDERAGSFVQFKVAQKLVDLIGPEKVDKQNFAALAAPLTAGMSVEKEPFAVSQESLVRDATERLLTTMALIAADGDLQKAKEIIGHSMDEQVHQFIEHPEFVNPIQETLARDRRLQKP